MFQQQTNTLSVEPDSPSLKGLPALCLPPHQLVESLPPSNLLLFQSGLDCGCENNKGSRRMDAREETLNILNKIWVKLQGLPNASPLELGAFFILLTFILVVLLMVVLTCVTCCCCRKTKLKGPNI